MPCGLRLQRTLHFRRLEGRKVHK